MNTPVNETKNTRKLKDTMEVMPMSERNFGERILADGVTVSNDTWKTLLNNNDIIIAKTGGGKTSGYISYNLASPNGSYIVSDTKGQLFKRFGKHLENLGYQVKVLDFVRPERSCSYNPLSYIRKNKDGSYREQDIKKLASLIKPSLDLKDPYWDKAAIRYISMLIGFVLDYEKPKNRTMGAVVRANRKFHTEEGKMEIQNWMRINPDAFSSKKYAELKDLTRSEKTWACILDFAQEAIDPFGYSEFSTIFDSKDQIDIPSIGKQKTVVFLNVSDNDPTFHIFSNIFNVQAMQVLIEQADDSDEGRLEVPTRFIFDDFAAGPTVENIDNLLSIVRSREISISLIIQSKTQLLTKYSEPVSNTIIANCDHIIFLGGQDPVTSSFLAKRMNVPQKKVEDLPADKTIVIEGGKEPIIAKRLKPFTAEMLLRYYDMSEQKSVDINMTTPTKN